MRRPVIAGGLELLFGAAVAILNGCTMVTRRRLSGLRRALSKGLFRFLLRSQGPAYLAPREGRRGALDDLVFVIPAKARGWILEGMCKDLQRYYPGKSSLHYDDWRLPEARAYFFPHYAIYPRYLENNPRLWGRKAFVHFTHPRRIWLPETTLAAYLNHASRVVCMSPTFYPTLEGWGVRPEKLTFILGAADDRVFRPRDRDGDGAVGFCTAYYERKRPDTVLEIVRRMPHRRFLLLGRNWQRYPRFAELLACPNFRYVEAAYGDYPDLYAQMDVFVSVSRLEGGPVPLIEAMMSNRVPVASRTGFAPQIIEHGRNGFLFDIDAPADEICALIENAFALRTDIHATVGHLTWRNCARQLAAMVATAPDPLVMDRGPQGC